MPFKGALPVKYALHPSSAIPLCTDANSASLKIVKDVRAVNYNHFGAPKRWYAVPSAGAPAFEDTFKSALPDKFELHPDLLFHLTAMLSPRTLLDHNVPVFAVLQASQLAV